MAIYDLYGSLSDDIHGAKEILEKTLGIRLESRDSGYMGGEYFQFGQTSDEHFVLKRNHDPFDGGPAEMSFPLHRILLYLNDTTRATELREKILETKRFVALRHEDLD